MLVNFLAQPFQGDLPAAAARDSLSLDRVCVIVLAGGEGTRLFPLTEARAKPVVPFGGRYHLIDVPISHSLNSGLRNIYVIGQYMAYTLQKHLFKSYLHHGISQEKIQLLVPEERKGRKVWYQGTADAVRQNLDYFKEVSADYFLILSGDQLYNIDFRDMVRFAQEANADMTIAAQPVNHKNAKRMGLLRVAEESSLLTDFYEKPQHEEVLQRFYTDEATFQAMGAVMEDGHHYLGSMGIYLFKRQAMFDLLIEDHREDFGKHLIQTSMQKGNTHAYLYDGYWEDIGTIESYYHANLALTRHADDTKRGMQCYDERNLILTSPYYLPGAKVGHTIVHKSLICEGCIVEGKEVTHSILGVRTRVGKNSVIRDSIVMGCEFYKREPLVTGETQYCPKIGEDCLIEKAIIDENVRIGNKVHLVNHKKLMTYDPPDGEPRVYVRDGIIVVPRGSEIPSGYVF